MDGSCRFGSCEDWFNWAARKTAQIAAPNIAPQDRARDPTVYNRNYPPNSALPASSTPRQARQSATPTPGKTPQSVKSSLAGDSSPAEPVPEWKPDPALQPKPGWHLANPAAASDDVDILFWGSRLPHNIEQRPPHAVPLDDLIWMYAGRDGPREWRLQVHKEILRQGITHIPLNGNLSDLASSTELAPAQLREDRGFPLWTLSPKVLCFLYRCGLGPPGYRAILRLVLRRQGFHVPIEGNLAPKAQSSTSWEDLLAQLEAEEGGSEAEAVPVGPSRADDQHLSGSDQARAASENNELDAGSSHPPVERANASIQDQVLQQPTADKPAQGDGGTEGPAVGQKSAAQTLTWAVGPSEPSFASGSTNRVTRTSKPPVKPPAKNAVKKSVGAKASSRKGKEKAPPPNEEDFDELESQ